MGNIAESIKKITSNKNTVTILGVVLGIFVLYIAYTIRVNAAVSTISVPYAIQQISPGTQIIPSLISTKSMPRSMIKGKVITNYYSVVNKYSSANTVIPQGSLFYQATVVEKDQLPTNVILDYEDGYVLYNMNVDINSTYGNSFYPGNYIDIYLKVVSTLYDDEEATSKDNKVLMGKLLKNIKILAVKDSNGEAVFEDLDAIKVPSMIVFAIPEEYYILLRKSEYLSTYSASLIPVPTNESLKDNPGKLELASNDLKDWINRVTIMPE